MVPSRHTAPGERSGQAKPHSPHPINGRPSLVKAYTEQSSGRTECEHIAALLKSPEEVPLVVAYFLRLGATRNGWLVHGSLPGQRDADAARLEEAGLDVSGLTRRRQLDILELDLTLSPEEWVRPWSTLLDERLNGGFDALWFTRFPVGPDEAEIADLLPFEDAWMRCFTGRRVVTLCPYVLADMSALSLSAQAQDVASVHDRIIDLRAG